MLRQVLAQLLDQQVQPVRVELGDLLRERLDRGAGAVFANLSLAAIQIGFELEPRRADRSSAAGSSSAEVHRASRQSASSSSWAAA